MECRASMRCINKINEEDVYVTNIRYVGVVYGVIEVNVSLMSTRKSKLILNIKKLIVGNCICVYLISC